MPSGRRVLMWAVAGVLAALGLGLVALVLVRLGPEWLTDTDGLSAVQADEARGRVRTALFALAAGVIALVGAVYTARTFALNRRGQITERFTRAIDQLGSEKMATRLGGIYALERIAHESADEHGPIVEILAAYLRNNSPAVDPGTDDDREPMPATVDIKAVVSVLARRNTSHERDRPLRVDLSYTNLAGVDALGIDLSGARLIGADLRGARLGEARLMDAYLNAANLRNANLSKADVRRASLLGANLRAAELDDTDVSGAKFHRTAVQGVDLSAVRGLDWTQTDGLLFDSDTKWPRGMTPSGMTPPDE